MKKTIISALSLAALLVLSIVAAATAQPGRMRDHGGPMGDDRDDRGGRLDRLASYLNLTDAQKTQVQQLQEKTRQSLEPLFQEHRQLIDQVEAALDSNADAATVGAAVIAAHQQGEKIRALREQHEAELAAILTPAQLERWQSLKEARKEGHRWMRPPIPGLGDPDRD